MRVNKENSGACIKLSKSAFLGYLDSKNGNQDPRADGTYYAHTLTCGAIINGRKCKFVSDAYTTVENGQRESNKLVDSKFPCEGGN